jgi:ketosteroid isomerase-like protein
MSQQNVEVVKRAYEAWNRGDIATVLDSYDPDVEWWDRDDDPDATVHRGLDAVLARFGDVNDSWAELRLEPHEFIDAGDFVVVPLRMIGRGRGSGALLEGDEVHAMRLREGKIVEAREYRQKQEALAAIDAAQVRTQDP